MKKILSAALAALMAVSAAAVLTACNEQEFPVEVANYKIAEEPKSVVVLDAATADIIAYMNFNRKLVGRSDSVTQAELADAPSVGSETDPAVNEIAALGTDLVFCNENLSKDASNHLQSAGIQVITLQKPNTVSEVKTNYETIAKVLSGKQSGMRLGKEAYSKLELDLERQEHSVEGYSNPNEKNTICYLYMNGSNLTCLTNGTYGDILMGYTNCKNIFSYDDATPDTPAAADVVKQLAAANPNFIFYNDDATLQALAKDKTLAKLKAVTGKKMLQIPLVNMSLPGITAEQTLGAMINFIYADKMPKTTEAVSLDVANTKASAAATEPSEEDLSAQYKINLKDLTLAKTNNSDNVKIMQQRLFDLGYIKKNGEDTNITGYYGDVTETAVKAFQKANGMNETGEADNATLMLMFSTNAKKAS